MTYKFLGFDEDHQPLRLLFENADGMRVKVCLPNFLLGKMPRDLAVSYTACGQAAASIIAQDIPIKTRPQRLGDLAMI